MSTAPTGNTQPQRHVSPWLLATGSFMGLCALIAGLVHDVGPSDPLQRAHSGPLPIPLLAAILVPAGYLAYRIAKAAAHKFDAAARREPEIAGAVIALGTVLALAALAKANSGPMSPTRLPGSVAAHDISGDASILKEHVTLPPGSVVAGGTTQFKVFRLHNTGTIDWVGRFLCRADPGMNTRDNLRTKECVPIPTTSAGQTVDVSVEVKVADREGTMIATFKMSDGRGNWYFSDATPVRIELNVHRR